MQASGTGGAFQPSRMREARERAGYALAALAREAGVSRQTLNDLEKGKKAPQAATLTRIAQALNVDVSFLALPGNTVDVGPVCFRSAAATTKKSRTRSRVLLSWMIEVHDVLARWVDFPEPVLFQTSPENNDDIERLADELRERWDLGTGPIPDIVGAMERFGVVVSRVSLKEPKQDGLSAWSTSGDRPFVLLNADKGVCVRSRFDAAHELGHCIMHRSLDPDFILDKDLFKKVEGQAHRFAGAFIMPREAFLREVRSKRLADLLPVKERWGLSIAAIVARGTQLGVFTEDDRRRLYIGTSKRGWRTEEPLDGEVPVERPTLLADALELITQEGGVSPSSLRAELGLPVRDLERLCGVSEGYFTAQDAPKLRLRASAGANKTLGGRSDRHDRPIGDGGDVKTG